jgi:hypothetical protein
MKRRLGLATLLMLAAVPPLGAAETGAPTLRTTVRTWLDGDHPLPALATAHAAVAQEPRSAPAWAAWAAALFRNGDF